MALPILIGLMAAAGGAGAFANRQEDLAQGRRFAANAEGTGYDPNVLNQEGRLAYDMTAAGDMTPQQFFDTTYNFRNLADTMTRHREGLALDRDRFNQRTREWETAYGAQLAGAVPNNIPGGDFELLFNGLIGMESGGNPGAISSKGAEGLTQIRDVNIVPFTRAVGMGVGMTDQEILDAYRSNPQFQYNVGRANFANYVQQYGERDALVKWHAGPGTSWEQVVADKARPPGQQVYHDGNKHTYDYVTEQLRAYATQTAAADRQRKLDTIAQTYPELMPDITGPGATIHSREAALAAYDQQVQTRMNEVINPPAPYDPMMDPERLRTAQQGVDEALIDQGIDPLTGEMLPGTDTWQPTFELPDKDQRELVETLQFTQQGIDAIQDAIEFVREGSTQVGRITGVTRGERIAAATRLEGEVVEALRRMEDKGVLQGPEYEALLKRIGGSLRGREASIIPQLEATLETMVRRYGDDLVMAGESIHPDKLARFNLRDDPLTGRIEEAADAQGLQLIGGAGGR